MFFFVERLHVFFLVWRGCMTFAGFVCVERLRDFSHSLSQSGCMIYFSGGYMIFLQRDCVIFIVKG